MAKKSPVSMFFTKIKSFEKTADNFSEKTGALVVESVELLWEHGNIEVVNRVISAFSHIKGIDVRALVTYYKQCVPFTYKAKAGMFLKKDDDKAKNMASTWRPFIIATDWHSFSKVKEPVPYTFDADKLVTLVHNRLEKAKENGQLSADTAKSLKAKLANELDMQLADMGKHINAGVATVQEAVAKQKASKKAA